MANLSVTLRCNRDCPYCFARAGREEMGRETFLRSLDFLRRSGIDQVRLLGGEPTLHPDFAWFVEQALERSFSILVFSNGLMPETALRCLTDAPEDRVSVLVNVNTSGDELPAANLDRLGRRAVPGFNIHTAAPEMDSLLSLIERHDLDRCVRLGLAHPSPDATNVFLRPKDYAPVGRRVAEFARKAAARGVTVEFDCGFVPCMFPEGFLESAGVDPSTVGPRCGAIPDILPDGSAVPCYPLASLARTATVGDAAGVRRTLDERMRPCRALGLFRECAACAQRAAGRCAGGCLAAAMLRLRRAPFEAARPARKGGGDRDTRRWVVPYVDQPLSFWRELREEFGDFVREVYFPLPGGIVSSGRPSQPDARLREFLRERPFAASVLVNPITLPRPVEEIAPSVIETLGRLRGEFGIVGATVSNLSLATRIREKLPDLPLTASVLMDVARPNQVLMLDGIFDALVPSGRIMRDLPALAELRAAFRGRIRLIVNEACLPGCPLRVQHFHEMAGGSPCPRSLCDELLERQPWMRLTGAWVLPQHLHLYDGMCDEWKLAGRVTLRDPGTYRQVLAAYAHRRPLTPDAIGGGPASVLEPLEIDEEFFARTLRCGHRCHECDLCRVYFERAALARREVGHGERRDA